MSKLIAAALTILLLLVITPIVLQMSDEHATPESSPMLPWQIEILDDGSSRVFGLTPGLSPLDEARALFGPDVEIAIVAPPGRPPLLEAFYESASAGFITGKLILTADLDSATIAAMRARALKESYMESVTRKVTLHPDDLASARLAAIRAITFIPSADLDEDVIRARFGEPGQRIRRSEEIEHFLYPELGLDIALSARGKEVLQYVAPRHFDRVVAPLREPGVEQD